MSGVVPIVDVELASLVNRGGRTRSVVDETEELEERNCCGGPSRTFIIDPQAMLRGYWDNMVLMMIIFSITYDPLEAAILNKSREFDTIGWVIDILYFTDIVVQFCTAYFDHEVSVEVLKGNARYKRLTDEGILEMQPSKVAWNYLTGWFLIDFPATMPWDFVLRAILEYSGGDGDSALTSNLLVKNSALLRLLRLIRVLRVLKASRVIQRVLAKKHVRKGAWFIVRLLFSWIFLLHILACLFFLVGRISASNSDMDDAELLCTDGTRVATALGSEEREQKLRKSLLNETATLTWASRFEFGQFSLTQVRNNKAEIEEACNSTLLFYPYVGLKYRSITNSWVKVHQFTDMDLLKKDHTWSFEGYSGKYLREANLTINGELCQVLPCITEAQIKDLVQLKANGQTCTQDELKAFVENGFKNGYEKVGDVYKKVGVDASGKVERFCKGEGTKLPTTYLAYQRYTMSIYWAITTVSTIGYGDVTPKGTYEIGFVAVVEFIGMISFAYTVTTLAKLINDLNAKEVDYGGCLDRMIEYMNEKKTSKDLKLRVIQYMHFAHNSRFYDAGYGGEEQMLGCLSLRLRDELRADIFYPKLRQMGCIEAMERQLAEALDEPTAKSMIDDCVYELSLNLSVDACMSGTLVVKAGDTGDEMYIVLSGKVTVWASEDDTRLYSVSAVDNTPFFGLVEMLKEMDTGVDEVKDHEVISDDYCDFAVVNKTQFQAAMEGFEDVLAQFKLLAEQEAKRMAKERAKNNWSSVGTRMKQMQSEKVLSDSSPAGGARRSKLLEKSLSSRRRKASVEQMPGNLEPWAGAASGLESMLQRRGSHTRQGSGADSPMAFDPATETVTAKIDECTDRMSSLERSVEDMSTQLQQILKAVKKDS